MPLLYPRACLPLVFYLMTLIVISPFSCFSSNLLHDMSNTLICKSAHVSPLLNCVVILSLPPRWSPISTEDPSLPVPAHFPCFLAWFGPGTPCLILYSISPFSTVWNFYNSSILLQNCWSLRQPWPFSYICYFHQVKKWPPLLCFLWPHASVALQPQRKLNYFSTS